MDIIAYKKAELILDNNIYISKKIRLPYPLDKSTAGPSSGSLSIAFKFANKHIKLLVNRDQNHRFQLKKENGRYDILRYGEIFLENLEIIPIQFHAPYQIFLNIEDRCKYGCAFCNLTQKGLSSNFDGERFLNIIQKSLSHNDFQAIALTSGVYPNNDELIDKICFIVKKIRQNSKYIPIGVETCISKQKELLHLKESGVDEIKINLQISDEKLFKKICPDFDYEEILDYLKEAVNIFGIGKVTTNIIYGIGESEKSLIKTIEKLALLGVVPTLRKIRVTGSIEKKMEDVLSNKLPEVSVNKIIRIGYEHKRILKKHGLHTKTFKTMCHKCGCCDIVPFWDI